MTKNVHNFNFEQLMIKYEIKNTQKNIFEKFKNKIINLNFERKNKNKKEYFLIFILKKLLNIKFFTAINLTKTKKWNTNFNTLLDKTAVKRLSNLSFFSTMLVTNKINFDNIAHVKLGSWCANLTSVKIHGFVLENNIY